MVIVWLVASNLGLWFQAFKQYQWANYFHLYAMAIVTIITWMSGFLAIMEYGVSADFHMGLGVTILILLILQCLGGIVSRSFQAIAKTAPMKVAWANLLHRVFGWILMILVMIQLLAVTR